MFKLSYELSSYADLLQKLSYAFGGSLDGNILYAPKVFKDGNIVYYKLSNGVEIIITIGTTLEPLQFIRQPGGAQLFTLTLDFTPEVLKIKRTANEEHIEYPLYQSGIASLLLPNHKNITDIPVETFVKNIQITFDYNFFKFVFLEPDAEESPVNIFFWLSHITQNTVSLNTKSMEIGNEIFQLNHKDVYSKLSVEIKIMQLIEQYVYQVKKKVHDAEVNPYKPKPKDVEIAIQIETILNQYITSEFPTLEFIAQKMSKSTTSLKTSFKSVFGVPIYQYFQQLRLEFAAKQLLNSTHSISAIGNMIGYKSLGHFSAEFTKRYSVNPKDYRKKKLS
jgi:AraC-like DNA-binding protein